MSTIVSHADDSPRLKGLPFVAVIACVALLASAAAIHPLLLLAALVMFAGGALLWRSVDWATYVVLFVVYSNIAVVAVKFHSVPSIAANGVIGLLAIPLGAMLLIRREPLVLGPCFPWIIGFACVQLLGAVFARQPELAWEGLTTFLSEGLLLYLLVVNVVRTPRALRGATWSLLFAGCLLGGVPLYQQLTGSFENQFGGLGQTGDEPGFDTGTSDTPQLRLSGAIGEKNRYAQVMLLLVPLAIFRWRDERSRFWKACANCALIMSLAGTFLAFSRSSILAAGLVLLLAARWRHVSRKSVAVVMTLAVIGLLLTPQYRARLASLLDIKQLLMAGKHSEADGALKGRLTEMGAAALVFVDHPLVGVGPGQFRYYSREYGERIGVRALAPERQAHCLPLDVAAENGIIGLTCLVVIFGTLTIGLLQQTQLASLTQEQRGLAATYLYMIAMYAATGLFLHFAFIRYFWVMIALASAAMVMLRGSAGKESDSLNWETA